MLDKFSIIWKRIYYSSKINVF